MSAKTLPITVEWDAETFQAFITQAIAEGRRDTLRDLSGIVQEIIDDGGSLHQLRVTIDVALAALDTGAAADGGEERDAIHDEG